MRLAVTGGRDHVPTSLELSVFDVLWTALGASTLVHGDARGVDRFVAAHVARTYPGAQVMVFPAQWHTYGRSAGHRRNGTMLRWGVRALIAFPGGRGTANCVEQAQRLRIPVHFIDSYVNVNGDHQQGAAGNEQSCG